MNGHSPERKATRLAARILLRARAGVLKARDKHLVLGLSQSNLLEESLYPQLFRELGAGGFLPWGEPGPVKELWKTLGGNLTGEQVERNMKGMDAWKPRNPNLYLPYDEFQKSLQAT